MYNSFLGTTVTSNTCERDKLLYQKVLFTPMKGYNG